MPLILKPAPPPAEAPDFGPGNSDQTTFIRMIKGLADTPEAKAYFEQQAQPYVQPEPTTTEKLLDAVPYVALVALVLVVGVACRKVWKTYKAKKLALEQAVTAYELSDQVRCR